MIYSGFHYTPSSKTRRKAYQSRNRARTRVAWMRDDVPTGSVEHDILIEALMRYLTPRLFVGKNWENRLVMKAMGHFEGPRRRQ